MNQPRSRSQTTGGLRHSSIVVQMENVGREVVAVDDEVRPVADADLVDLGEELVGRMPCEDVGRAGLDADPDERQEARVLPRLSALELVVAELHARQLVRPLGVRLGERHRHVEIRHPRVEARVEDRLVEDWVDGVEDRVRLRLADQLEDRVATRGVDRVRREATVVERGGDGRGAGRVVVRQGAVVEEGASGRDRGERGANTTCPDHEKPHGRRFYQSPFLSEVRSKQDVGVGLKSDTGSKEES